MPKSGRQLSRPYNRRLETLAAAAYTASGHEADSRRDRPPKCNISVDEVTKTGLFLCNDLSSDITGSIIPVDAGYHIMAV